MNRAEVMTPWVAAIPGDDMSANHPKLMDDHALQGWEDITGQPAENLSPTPNIYVIRITCDDITLAAIEADLQYEVLTSEVIDEIA